MPIRKIMIATSVTFAISACGADVSRWTSQGSGSSGFVGESGPTSASGDCPGLEFDVSSEWAGNPACVTEPAIVGEWALVDQGCQIFPVYAGADGVLNRIKFAADASCRIMGPDTGGSCLWAARIETNSMVLKQVWSEAIQEAVGGRYELDGDTLQIHNCGYRRVL